MREVGRLDHDIGGSNSPPGRVIAAIALEQHGVVAHRQLVAGGLSARQVDVRLANGQLVPVHRGVYAAGHAGLSRLGRWMAAVLACGPGALLSHRDAARLWGLPAWGGRGVDVTAARSRTGHPGIVLHRPREVHPDDRAEVDGIPVTSVARTLLDCAPAVGTRRLDRLVEEAELRKLFDLRAVDALLERSRGRPGVARLRHAIAGARPFVPFTRSQLERVLLSICHDAGLPEPAMNVWLAGREVDALFAEQRLVVEIDGAAVHGTRHARRRDARRDLALQQAGYHVIHVSEEWLRNDPADVARTIREALESQWAA